MNVTIEPLIISAPFGNYLKFAGCTSTLGTFTLLPRGGLAYRLWRCALTLRYDRRTKSWINRLGLPNPGLDSLPGRDLSASIVSIHGFSGADWELLAGRVSFLSGCLAVEMNLSCPNVADDPDFLSGAVLAASRLAEAGVRVIVKLPPVRWMDLAIPLFYDGGVRCFHCCNTIPTPGGGLSGKPSKQYSLWAIRDSRRRFAQDVMLIGGGGITCEDDVREYRRAGADHVAIASALLNPFNWRKVPRLLAAAREAIPT